jgi:BolA protein
MGLDKQIRAALEQAFDPEHLEVINESAQHHGHAGDDGSGESHWRIVIATRSFEGMTRLSRHRAIHTALGPDIINRLHALAIDIT